MALVRRVRCLGCGSVRHLKHFGIVDDVFEGLPPERVPVLLIDDIGGRGHLKVEHHSLPLELARAQRAALREALRRLDAEIAAAEGDD